VDAAGRTRPPSFLKGIALAVGTLALSTWALGSLWLQAEEPGAAEVTAVAGAPRP
jgi:hypothetical protein